MQAHLKTFATGPGRAALWAAVFSTIFAATADAVQSRSYAVVDTNQTHCYGVGHTGRLSACPTAGAALYGQDAHYAINPPRYRDNGDGTVSDLVTGLMWQKGFSRNVRWSDADARARRATTAGHSDWRVPTIKELYSLIDFSGHQGSGRPESRQPPRKARPFLDTSVFDFEYPTRNRYIDAQYISATAYRGRTMGRSPTFFGVNFADGRIKGYPQRGRRDGGGWYLRLVRGQPAYGRNDFRDNGDGTVSDRATGLTWMQNDSGDWAVSGAHYRDGRMDWPEALSFCEGLSLAGTDDWRLPNAKELHSLLDYERSPQATGSAAIAAVFGVSSIKNEAGERDYPAYWSSTSFRGGRVSGRDAVIVHFGQAMGAPHGRGLVDVHGAGAQRTDPKTGDADAYPQWGHGPQGDVRRVYNHVRCVRGGG